MYYFPTLKAAGSYGDLLRYVSDYVDKRMEKGIFPFLAKSLSCRFPKDCNPEDQFKLPIFYVAEEDLGNEVELSRFRHLADGELKTFAPFPVPSLPETISIPSPGCFNYLNINTHEIFAPNETIKDGSHDWLGVYYNHISGKRSIFIRIEKIMETPGVDNMVGATSIVLHELGHALMDTFTEPKLSFEDPEDALYGDMLSYIMEEAMANLIAFRSVKSREYTQNSDEVRGILCYVSSQPYPYALGGEIAKVLENTSPADMIYPLKWYAAKRGRRIKNVKEWWSLVNPLQSFTPEEIKKQIRTLF